MSASGDTSTETLFCTKQVSRGRYGICGADETSGRISRLDVVQFADSSMSGYPTAKLMQDYFQVGTGAVALEYTDDPNALYVLPEVPEVPPLVMTKTAHPDGKGFAVKVEPVYE